MGCEEIREHLSEYVDGVLDPETKSMVDEHLSACKACREELGALKALVGELGSMEAVSPPEDFLEQLHARMERRPFMSSILRKLFMPMRIKVPLELAGAVALVVLVFSILHLQQAQFKMPGRPEPYKQEATVRGDTKVGTGAEGMVRPVEKDVAEVSPADSLGKEAERKTYAPQRAYRAATAEESEEGRPIELTLVMRRPRADVLTPGALMEASRLKEREMRKTLAMKKARPSRMSEKEEKIASPISELKSIVELFGGKVTSVEHERESGVPLVVCAEIPSARAISFYEKLKALGDLEALPKAKAGKEKDVLRVRIRILPPE
ncbi:MAG: zf-HC2 domain-containing protein [Deltaproteobacteria bacterium]|nr:zf-HC2 domain-containing protein [Deltaproteobacteria bacterium]MBW2136790.1 zf-HC2 domain-containing protein [Deltaproteobacteria bacterium]